MRYTKYITLVALLFAAVACTNYEFDVEGGLNNGVEGATTISIYGNVTRFSDYEVGTRANKTPEESYVSNMALAVFAIEDGKCIHYELRDGSNLLFTLDRSEIQKEHEGKYNNEPCVMYVLANMPDLPATGTFDGTKEYLLNLALSATGITRPDKGFPMIGTLGDEDRDGKEFVLMPMNGNRMELPLVNDAPTDYLNIPMNAIFAKISFEITVASDQDVDVHAPASFEMTGYDVHYIASSVSFNEDKNKEKDEDNNVVQGVSTEPIEVAFAGIAQGGDEGGGSSINFDFYLPERLLDPETSAEAYPYPLGETGGEVTGYTNIPAKHKKFAQRYKPLLLGKDQQATYVTIKGKYRDHQEYYHDVHYDIYLGADNYGDFNIKRNGQYINKLTIKGITSSADQSITEGAISIDHRVNVTRSTPLIISLRRETQLDAHYEVRPLRLRMAGESVPAGAKVTVEVLNEDGTTTNRPAWVRLEKSGNTSEHITSGVSAGKRKYFTTDLVTNTLAGGTEVEVEDLDTDENTTVWIYVDENTNASTVHDTRSATIRVTYYEGDEKKDEKDYVISQYNLHKIQGESGNDYTIECYEEYLYNYDSEEPYGQIKEEGLPWGLDGEQLSSKHLSFQINEDDSDWEDYIEDKPTHLTYDFYIFSHDAELMKKAGFTDPENSDACHKYAGQEFTSEIVSKAGVNYLRMDQQAINAVEYCYNRNKRNPDGTVKVEWYLPSADELEDFIVPAYSYYEEFQNNYYWTSQPAYYRNVFYYETQRYLIGGTYDAYHFVVYEDNPNYARATKIDNYEKSVKSGLKESPDNLRTDTPWSGNTEKIGYFNVWHAWKKDRWNDTTTPTITKENESAAVYTKYENRTQGGRYGAYLGHWEDLIEGERLPNGEIETGYRERTESHRVRCVRKVD